MNRYVKVSNSIVVNGVVIRESRVYQVLENKNAKENRILRLGKNKNVNMKSHLNSSFFLNWCNVNPAKIMKSNQLWLRGFVSIILNPFLRVFAISAFLKVIHATKTPNFRYLKKNLPTYIFSNPRNRDFP